MKKSFILLLMLVYGMAATGATITLHYCCGKLDDISFSTKNNSDSCPMGGDHSANSDCCKDKQVSAKLYSDQQNAIKLLQQSKLIIDHPVYPALNGLLSAIFVDENRHARGTPVPISTIPIFIKNRVFRI